jgi:hypothetical protein
MVFDYDEEDAAKAIHRAKFGDYTGDDCPYCGRERVVCGDDGNL